jgi:polygalacturonase
LSNKRLQCKRFHQNLLNLWSDFPVSRRMKLIPAFIILALTWLSSRTQPATTVVTAAGVPAWEKAGGAVMAPTNNALFSATEYKAAVAGNILNAKAIQTAISVVAKRGGAVPFSLGQYLTSSLFFKEGIKQASSLLENVTLRAATLSGTTAKGWSFHDVGKAENKEPVAVLNSPNRKP